MLRQIGKKAISHGLQVMEQGTFQDFCLRFFPLCNIDYQGMIRHGATAAGKTRKGHPDIIKTSDDGKIIAGECSTEENYWKKPPSIEKWKPIKDIEGCVADISAEKISNIILCSSQEIPTDLANAKSDIFEYCRGKGYTFELEVWSNAKFEEEIAINAQKYATIIQEFFPDLVDLISNTAQTTATKIIQLYKETRRPLDLIENIVGSNLEKDSDELKALVLESRHCPFQRVAPAFLGIRRNLDWDLLGGLANGRVTALIGQPKVGKTNLIAQFCSSAPEDFSIRWFDCPPSSRDARAFENDIFMAIFQHFIEPRYVNEYLLKRISFDDMFEHVEEPSNSDVLIVIDNAENIEEDSFKAINHEVEALLSRLDLKSLGIIFISSKSLKRQLPILHGEYVCPIWTLFELKELLIYNKIDIADAADDYVKVLHPITNGHPIVSVAMAKKYPSIKQLLFERKSLEDRPLVDAELSQSVKEFMFDELLKDPEDRNLVLCASPLIYDFTKDDLEQLIHGIYPNSSKPINLIVEGLYGTIFEGQRDDRLNVAYVFKEVANGQTSMQFKLDVYLESAKNRLEVKNNEIDGWRVCEGINYSLLAQDFDKAIFWTALTLSRLYMDEVAEDVVKAMLNRIDFIIYYKPPKEEKPLMSYIQVMLLFRWGFKKIGDKEKASLSMKNLEIALNKSDTIKNQPFIEANRAAMHVYQFLDNIEVGDFKNALNALNKLEPLDIGGYDIANKELLLVLDGFAQQIEPTDFPLAYYSKAIQRISPIDTDAIAYMTSSFVSWASRSAQAGLDNSVLLQEFESLNYLSKILVGLYGAQYEHEKNNRDEALNRINIIYSIAEEWKLYSRSALRYIILLEADLRYNGYEETIAWSLYEEVLDFFNIDSETFYLGWCNKQLAKLCQDASKALILYGKAENIFMQLGSDFEYSKTLGERGILIFKLGREVEAMAIFKQIIDEYYIKNNPEFGPPTIIAVSLLYNISKNEIPVEKDLKIKNGMTHVGFKRGVFTTVLRGHHPQAGIACAYFELAECYRKYHQIDLARDCLKSILLSNLDTVAEAHCYAQGVFQLEPEYRKRAVHQYNGLVKLLDKEVPLESLLNYGRSLYVIWGFHEPKIIPAWDGRLVNVLVGGARTIGSVELGDQQRLACMLLLFLAVTIYEENEKVDSLKETLLSIVRPITNLLPVQIKRIIEK